ncbi:MAG TPA: YdjY domain-containing protein [Gemmataceae bacterium]|jgi:hypothetical protein|nr:YdjY domain-containing protein [Gemmataceae bacterium]
MRVYLVSAGLLLCTLLCIGCEQNQADPPKPAEKPKDTPAKPVESKKTALNKLDTLFLETFPDGRKRILIESEVCLREGILEQLLCRLQTKEHEAILHANVDARMIHAALEAIKAKPGSTVKYDPKFQPPTGTTIKVKLEYEKSPGEKVTVNARDWIRNIKTGKALDVDWVFAGSQLFQDPDDPKKVTYQANYGDVICVANFPTAMLDVPIDSPKVNRDVSFEAWTDRIPAVGTKVTVILEPVLDEKKK